MKVQTWLKMTEDQRRQCLLDGWMAYLKRMAPSVPTKATERAPKKASYCLVNTREVVNV